jgi:hypothetical protein
VNAEDGTEVSAVDDAEGLPDEPAGSLGDTGRFQGGRNRIASAEVGQEAVDAGGIRPAAGHRPVVKLEMARKPTPPVVVTLLGQNDLVDEPAGGRVGGGQPRHFDAAQLSLQALE